MNYLEIIGRLLGQENVQSIDDAHLSFAAPWAQRGPAWLLFGAVGLAVLAGYFYTRYQTRGSRKARFLLGFSRAALLMLLLAILADPILTITTTSSPRPLLWVLLDGTESMQIEDDFSEEQRARLLEAVGLTPDRLQEMTPTAASPSGPRLSRAQYVQALLTKQQDNLLQQLEEKFRVQAFVLDSPDRVRQLAMGDDEQQLDPERIAAELAKPESPMTAIGAGLSDLASRHARSNLAGLVMISDFGQNTGPAPVGAERSPAQRLGVPIYTVGVGPETAVNLGLDLQARPVMKKGFASTLDITVRQTGLDGERAAVKIVARAVGAGSDDESFVVGERDVVLSAATVSEEFSFLPEEAGRFEFTATIDPLPEEVVDQDNTATRNTEVLDNFFRVLYVEYEPTWEWRFVKEVFHRDPMVGMRGFRTFLASADRNVRQTNELFLQSLTSDRKDFFANDVIFIGDMPASALNDRFCNMVKEFVTKFGGGLVITAGPRFGVGHLADTPLADILPVQVDYGAQIRDDRPFEMRLTPMAFQQDFMRLGTKDAGPAEIMRHWQNLGKLPWYQPVRAPHLYGTTVLAEHPTDTTSDGKTHQPLIAIREFERGSVIYLGFNETWRLRREHGEQYYRQFWGQIMNHLGLRRAMGSQKRFVVRTDQEQYKPDDRVLLSVVAYDENFEELTADKVPEQSLAAELILPGRSESEEESRSIRVPLLRDGVFETRIPVFAAGDYRLRVTDPVTGEIAEQDFEVANVSVERRSATRNVSLQRQLAAAHPGGKSYDLQTVSQLPDEIDVKPIREESVKVLPLWATWFCFGLVVLLMLGEWLGRKMIHLA